MVPGLIVKLIYSSMHWFRFRSNTCLLLPFVQLIDENRWYHFDDSHVSPVGEGEIKTSAAYVLFYRRVKGETNPGMGETSQAHSC